MRGSIWVVVAAVVAPIHPEAMPVFLTTPWEIEVWLNAGTALELQRPADNALRIVANGAKTITTRDPR
jgi:hypothetical protein